MIFETEFDQTFTCRDYSKTVRIPIRGKNPKSQGAEIHAKVTPLPENCHECPFWYQQYPYDTGTDREHWACFLKPFQDFSGIAIHRAPECPLEAE